MRIGSLLVEGDNQSIVYVPNGITHISAGAFIGCRDLEVLYLPDSLVDIGRRAFESCDSLKTIRFGKGLHRVSCLNPGRPSRDLLQNVSRPDSPTMAREL